MKIDGIHVAHSTTTRIADSVFYSSDGDNVYKNTAAGMRGSLGLNNVNNTGATVAATADKIVLRDSEGGIFATGVTIADNPGTLFSYSDGTRSVYGGCDSNDPWFGTSSNHDLRLVTYGGERMRIDNTGNVGIGTTSPATYLHLSANNSDPGATEGDFVGTHTLTEYMRFTSTGDGGDVNAVSVGFKLGGDDNSTSSPDGRLDICANDGAVAGNSYGHVPDKTIATFLGGGNVGIGDTTPSYKLDVNGDINVASGKKFRMNGTALANSAMITADDDNTASSIVQRDSNGNFSAGTITAALTGNASTATNADKLDDVHLDDIFNNMGGAHNNRSDFDDVPDAGCYYITGSTNGPDVNSASQYYGFTLGLGGHDPVAEGSSNGKYGCQIYWGRNVSNPYINLRYLENGAWGTWRKAAAGYADSAGTAAGCSGNAATATTATNQSGGTVSATSGTFSGDVGIGTTSPYCPLQVNGTGGSMSNQYKQFFRYDVNISGNYGWTANPVSSFSIYANGAICSGDYLISHNGTLGSSDERIKKNIVDADDAECLETLRLLKPKKYGYKDEINRGEEPVWGFIAQEVRDTLPYATELRRDVLPNIYELANVSSSNVITFTNFNTSNLESNATTLIRTKGIDGKDHDIHLVEVVDEHTIRVEEDLSLWTGSVDAEGNVITQIETTTLTPEEYESLEDKTGCVANISGYQNANVVISVEEYNGVEDTTGYEEVIDNYTKTVTTYPGTQLFIYGQEVDDFVFLKKEAIWTVATSALQEVDRQQQADKVRIAELETRVEELEAMVSIIKLNMTWPDA